MAAGFLITGVLLVLLLSELDYSSAFPRARSSMYPEAWQGIKEKWQGGHGFGNHRPLQYKALRQPHRKLQPNVQVGTWQKPLGSSSRVHSRAPIQGQPGLYHHTRDPRRLWSDVATKGTQEMSTPQPPLQRNHPLASPRSFEFNLKLPFVNILGQNKDSSSTTKGSDRNSGGSDGAGHNSQAIRPSSIHIQSSFKSPSDSDSFSDRGSTNEGKKEGKNDHEVSLPSFQLSFSLPIPPFPKHPSSNGVNLANLTRPGSDGVQNSYMKPEKPQTSSTQTESDWILLNSASAVQQQTQHQTYEPIYTDHTNGKQITFSPEHANQHTTPIEQVSQGKIPTGQSQVFPEPQAPSLPVPQYSPPKSDNLHSGYYSAQINPMSNDYGKGQSGQTVSNDPTNVHLSLSQSQYEMGPSGQFSSAQVKPSSNSFGQPQNWQPVATQPTFASEQYNYGQFKPSFGHGQNVETVPHLNPVQPAAPSQYELPPFGYHNREAETTNYYGTDNVGQMGQMDLSSSSPYHPVRGQSEQDTLPDILTAFEPSPNVQDLSTDRQTQMRHTGQYTGREKLDGKTKYTKVLIDVEDVMSEADGQHNYFAAPPTHYDGYSGKWTGQNPAETPISNPNPLFEKFQSLVPMGQDQPTKLLSTPFEHYPSNKPEFYMPVYNQMPTMDSGLGQYVSAPKIQIETQQIQTNDPLPGQGNCVPLMGANAASVLSNIGQQQISEPTPHTMAQSFGPSKQHHSVSQAQLQQSTSDQRTENNHPFSVNTMSQYDTYDLGHYRQNFYGSNYAGQETQYATQTDHAASPAVSVASHPY